MGWMDIRKERGGGKEHRRSTSTSIISNLLPLLSVHYYNIILKTRFYQIIIQWLLISKLSRLSKLYQVNRIEVIM